MTTGNGTAEILDMQDARARRRDGDNHYEHVGARLAAAREALGLSLKEAAGRTHIKEDHLAAIEAMTPRALPARPYAIGFVKAYAEFLDLEAAPVVARFKQDAGYEAPSIRPTAEKFQAAQDAAHGEAREMSLLAVLAVILFMIWCAWQIMLPRNTAPLGDRALEGTPAGPADFSGANVVDARILEEVQPVYPRRCAADARPAETVAVMFNITAAGRVAGEQIAQSSNACFDEAALNAVRRWVFEPRTVDGAARPAYDQRYVFTFQRPQ